MPRKKSVKSPVVKRPVMTPEMVKSIPRDVIKKVADYVDGDGWTIFAPEAFTKLGMTEEQIAPFIEVEKSDTSHPKSTIFDHEGNVMKECEGVYGLDLVQRIGRLLGLDIGQKMGRGFAAREACEALRKYADGQI